MILTRKKTIKLCIELWEWLAKTGQQRKEDWPGWEKYGEAKYDCWFCEYSTSKGQSLSCVKCPLGGGSFQCNELYYNDWKAAETPRTRKKYAKLFLEQIKTLK